MSCSPNRGWKPARSRFRGAGRDEFNVFEQRKSSKYLQDSLHTVSSASDPESHSPSRACCIKTLSPSPEQTTQVYIGTCRTC
eukprot:2635161-Rhodomonas_salina.1